MTVYELYKGNMEMAFSTGISAQSSQGEELQEENRDEKCKEMEECTKNLFAAKALKTEVANTI